MHANSLLIFETSLFAIAFFCTVISCFVLLSSRDGRSPANRFLAVFLAIMSLTMLMMYLIVSGYILNVPWLYRLPSPLFYFLFPPAYLYVRMVLLDETRARKTDWLHAIPAVLHVIELMPYFLQPETVKVANILKDSANPLGAMAHSEGWLPVYAHNLIRGFQGLFYGCMMAALLVKANVKRPAGKLIYPAMYRWLWVFTAMILLFSVSVVSTFLLHQSIAAVSRSAFLYIMMAGTQMVSGLFLLLNPTLLFGMPRLIKWMKGANFPHEPDVPAKGTTAKESGAMKMKTWPEARHLSEHPLAYGSNLETPVSGEGKGVPATADSLPLMTEQKNYDVYIEQLKQLMENKKPFLQKRYAMHQLATDMQVPQHHLSYLLNNIFNIRFSDYINQQRIDYICERLAKDELRNLTMEGLALEAGFSSRITFIRAVQKQTGMNPTEYFKLKPGHRS